SSLSIVQNASPLYFENNLSVWKPAGHVVGPPIRLLAFDPTSPPLMMPELKELAPLLTAADTVLFDRKSKEDFGDLDAGEKAELNGRTVTVIGHVSLGTDFADDGTILASDRTFNSVIYGQTPMPESLDDLDFGLIRLRDGVNLDQARDELDALLPPQVLVLTKQQYLDTELKFWSTATPIGYVFALGTAMGFLVGTIICYQILFADIADHLREFATLKAMGYRPRYFIGLVLEESLILSLLGFIPGTICAAVLYRMVAVVTGLLMNMSWERTLLVGALTAAMCVVSGCLTMNKVLQTDPAEMF
ncbi:MAG: FtsX-like permease family protein, partial [Pirellulales bacterium]